MESSGPPSDLYHSAHRLDRGDWPYPLSLGRYAPAGAIINMNADNAGLSFNYGQHDRAWLHRAVCRIKGDLCVHIGPISQFAWLQVELSCASPIVTRDCSGRYCFINRLFHTDLISFRRLRHSAGDMMLLRHRKKARPTKGPIDYPGYRQIGPIANDGNGRKSNSFSDRFRLSGSSHCRQSAEPGSLPVTRVYIHTVYAGEFPGKQSRMLGKATCKENWRAQKSPLYGGLCIGIRAIGSRWRCRRRAPQ